MPVVSSIDFCGPAWGYLGQPGDIWAWPVDNSGIPVDNSGDLWVNRGQAVDSLWISGRAGYLSLLLWCYLVAYHRHT